jgi:hypothetical protein
MKDNQERYVGKYDTEFNIEQMEELIEGFTRTSQDLEDVPVFTASEVSHFLEDGDYSMNTIRKYLEQLEEEGKIHRNTINQHTQRPLTLWIADGVEIDINEDNLME